jgi:hypothetical protein
MATLTTAALLETSRTSAMFGTGVTLTATLTGAAQPAGTVTFLAGAKTLGTGTLDTNAVATLATAELPAGAHRIAIRYGGDTNYTAAKSSIAAVTVTQATPAVTLKSSVASTTFGAGVTLTAAVTGPAEAAVPTGTVTFKTGSTTLGTGTVTGGVATLTTAALPVGLDSLTATYDGDTNYKVAPSAAFSESVSKATPRLTVTASSFLLRYGASVTLTATLSGGVATLATTALAVGSDSITAIYSGDSNYITVTSTAISVTATKQTPMVTLKPQIDLLTCGSGVTLMAKVTGAAGVAAPTGTVTFLADSATLGTGTLNGSAQAALSTIALPAGVDSLTVVYGGDTNYTTATSSAVTVSKATPAATLKLSAPSIAYAGPATLTATLTGANGVSALTGTVTFKSGTTTLGADTVTEGVATLTTAALPVGTNSLTASYGGDANYKPAAAAAFSEAVNKATPAATVTTSSSLVSFGANVTLAAAVTGPAEAAIPTGTVTFKSGSATLGAGTLSGGVATVATTALGVGSDSITTSYGGDSNYIEATSTAITVAVTKHIPVLTVKSSVSGVPYGTSAVLTATVNGASDAVAPTGLTFLSGPTTLGTGTLNAGSVATLATSVLPAGADNLTVRYGGDTNYTQAASPAVTVTVSQTTPTATLKPSPTGTAYGGPVTLTAIVPGAIGAAAPTGTVTFKNGTTTLGTSTVTEGVATLTTTALPVGADSLTASYSGDSNYKPATSAAFLEAVNKAAPAAVLTTSSSSVNFGSSVTLTATLAGTTGVAPLTGMVTFKSGSATLGTGTITRGAATLPTTALTVGSDSITASYGGDSNFAAATSAASTVIVRKAIPPATPAHPAHR